MYKEMYFDRVISPELENLLLSDEKLRWLVGAVIENKTLDLHIGKNANEEWISVYRGLSRIIKLKKGLRPTSKIKIEADDSYKALAKTKSLRLFDLDSIEELFNKKNEFNTFSDLVSKTPRFNKLYSKEGKWQIKISRRFGMQSTQDDPFIVIDRETCMGFESKIIKNKIMGETQREFKHLKGRLSLEYPNRFGKKLEENALGAKLDAIGIDRKGQICLIEIKDQSNAGGIYLSPFQIGLYMQIFKIYIDKYPNELPRTLREMATQKERIGIVPKSNIMKSLKTYTAFDFPKLIVIIGGLNTSKTVRKKLREVITFIRNKKPDWNFIDQINFLTFDEYNNLSEFNLDNK